MLYRVSPCPGRAGEVGGSSGRSASLDAGPQSSQQRGSKRSRGTRSPIAPSSTLAALGLAGLLASSAGCGSEGAPLAVFEESDTTRASGDAYYGDYGDAGSGGTGGLDLSGGGSGTIPRVPPEIGRIEVTEMADLPLVHQVFIEHGALDRVEVVPTCVDGDGEPLDGVTVQARPTAHWGETATTELFVLGLAFGGTCELQVRATGSNGETLELWESLESWEPSGFPELDTVVAGPGQQPGWTLFDLTHPRSNRGWTILVDDQQRPRWVQQTGAGYEDLHVSPQGVLTTGGVFGWTGGYGALSDVFQPDQHAVEPSPFNEGAFFQIVIDEQCEGEAYLVEALGDQRLGYFCPTDWFEAPDAGSGPDWTHLNGFDFYGDTGHMVLSFRNIEGGMLVGVDWPTGQIDWVAVDNDDFAEQHAPEVQENGRILLFDNGLDGNVSEAVELEVTINPLAGTATTEVVWRFTDPDGRHQGMFGDADRLPNGNVLASFGAPQDKSEPVLYEVTPSGDIVLELRGPASWTTYRAERFVCASDASLPPWNCPDLAPIGVELERN